MFSILFAYLNHKIRRYGDDEPANSTHQSDKNRLDT